MNIKNYKLFLEKDVNWRDDEDSYLNDGLNDRWDDSTYDPDGSDDNYEYDDDYDYGKKDYIHGYDEDDEDGEDIETDDMEHLLYLLRSMFKNSGIDARITNKKMDIKIFIELNKKERLKSLISIFEVVNKLKKDILIQYTCEFDMWQTASKPYFEFEFFYGKFGSRKMNDPF